MARVHYLEVDIYPYPNPALTAVLVGPKLEACVTEYTSKVVGVYAQKMANRPRKGDRHPGKSLQSMSAEVSIGGYKHDRWVGEISVGTEYALADEYGRKAYNPYRGHGDLRESLHSVLPARP